MKKLFRNLMLMAMAAVTFTACEDVPEPYDKPGTGSNTPGTSTEIEGAEGDGTLASPFNAIAALNYGKKLASGEESADYMYIKGKVSSIKEPFGTQFGNGTFYISEDGSSLNAFYAYRVLYLGNKKFAASDTQIQVGDSVIVCGKITNYNGTIETVQGSAFLYKLNNENRGGEPAPPTPAGEAKGDGTQANPYNVSAALSYIKSLGKDVESEKDVYIKAKVSTIKNNYVADSFGNATFYISDDGTANNEFYCYRALYLGNQKYAKGLLLQVGDEVVICGKVVNYKGNTPETVQNKAYLYSLNGSTEATEGGDDPTPTPIGDNILPNGDFEAWTGAQPDNWKSACSASSATLSQSTDAHGGSYSVLIAGNDSQNKRLASKEMNLKAGTYTFSFYAKSTTTNPAQLRPGYVPLKEGGAVGSYAYGDYAALTNTEWTLVSHSFTLTTATTVCLVVMSPKTSSYATAQDILLDDATLVTSDGGLADGGSGDESGQPGTSDANSITVAEFLAAAESTSVWYQLTGTISNLKDGDQYGNFDLTDETGSVYVYGVLSEKGGAKKLFQELVSAHGIQNGTTITIIGNRGSYNGKIEVTNAYFVSASNK